jgi:hypothetical protein
VQQTPNLGKDELWETDCWESRVPPLQGLGRALWFGGPLAQSAELLTFNLQWTS